MKSNIEYSVKSCLGKIERAGFCRSDQENYIQVNPLSILMYRPVYSYGKSPWKKFYKD